MKYFEELRVGDLVMTGSHTFNADEIKAFANIYDPQLFHIDEEAAKKTSFGALCASGWHTASTWMRLMVDSMRAEQEQMLARGEKPPTRGPALGLKDLKWLKPVYVGDTISYKSEITDLRVSASRPAVGLMTITTTGVNQNGQAAISFSSVTFCERRVSGPANV